MGTAALGLDMGGGLDLRAFVVAAPVNGEHFGAIDNANLVRIGKHRQHAPDVGVRIE